MDLTSFSGVVAYAPLAGEVPYRDFCSFNPDARFFLVSQDASVDPRMEAARARTALAGLRTCILVPGTRFDARGSRHGRGGGWFDRFLSEVPRSWTRIGTCFERQFSQKPLSRSAWDEDVDQVLVVSEADIRCYSPRDGS